MSSQDQGRLARWAGELVVIVVGVLIALGFDSWREERALRVMEGEYLSALAEDLHRDVREYEYASDLSERNESAAWTLLAQLGELTVGADSLAFVTIRAGYFYVPALSRVTFDDLTSTGNLQILRDRSLRRAVAEYYQLFDSRMQWVGRYRDVSDSYFEATRGVLGPATVTSFNLGRPLELTPTEGLRIISTLRARDEIPGLLEAMIAVQVRSRGEHRELKAAAESLLSRLEGRAGASP